jgi:hypothetical protein
VLYYSITTNDAYIFQRANDDYSVFSSQKLHIAQLKKNNFDDSQRCFEPLLFYS